MRTFGPGLLGKGFVFDWQRGIFVSRATPPTCNRRGFYIEAWDSAVRRYQSATSSGGRQWFILSYGSGGYGFGLQDEGIVPDQGGSQAHHPHKWHCGY